MGEKTMSSGRTMHVLHRGCVLATVLTLTSVLPACTQLSSKADGGWTITGITQKLALELLPSSNTLVNVVQGVLPSGYQATYADGIDINQSVDKPATELSWNDQIKAIATASGLAVRVDGKRVYFVKESADVTSTSATPKLVDATIMGMPRDGRRHSADAPAPLMTPQEAALLEKAQAAAATSVSSPASVPAAPSEASGQPSVEAPVQQVAPPAASAAVLAPETVPLVIIEEPTPSGPASPTPPAAEPAPVESQKSSDIHEAEKLAPLSPTPSVVADVAAVEKPVTLTPVAEPSPVEPQKTPTVQEAGKPAPVISPVVTPANPRLANITVMGTPEGGKLRPNRAVQPPVSVPAPVISPVSRTNVETPVLAAAPEPTPVSKELSPTPPASETVLVSGAEAEPVSAPAPVASAPEPEKPAAEVSLAPASSEPEKMAPAAMSTAERAAEASVSSAEAPVAMVPATPEERALASAAPTAPDLSAAVGSNFDTSKGRPVAAVGAWSAERGQTLHEVLQGWCERASVELNWSSNYDFPLKASVSIDDTFENAVRTLLTGFSGASPQPVGRLHRQANAGSRLLVIETRGNRYED